MEQYPLYTRHFQVLQHQEHIKPLLVTESTIDCHSSVEISNSSTQTGDQATITSTINLNETFISPDGLRYRQITFTKKTTGETYHATLYTLEPNNSTTQYKARVILLPNPGETVVLYHRTIKLLIGQGYECFYYPLSQSISNYATEDQLVREMNRIVKMCVDDLDKAEPRLPNHKVHLLGNFITGSLALQYAIDGFFNYRIKSVICVNPLIGANHAGMFKGNLMGSAKLKMMTKVGLNLKKKTKYFDLTSLTKDPEYLGLLQRSSNDDIGFLDAVYYLYLLKSISNLCNFKRPQKQIRNTFIIQTENNPFVKNPAEKSLQRFMAKIQPFINEKLGSKMFYVEKHDQEVTPAQGVNLFFERQDLFEKMMVNVLRWLEDN